MPVDKGSIDFYGEDIEGTHIVFIYGIDTERQIFFCKDFDGLYFAEFEVTFEAMRKSVQKYHRTDQQETDGFRAFRIDEKAELQIDYARTYSEFYKLGQEFASSEKGYGIGAIELYIKEIKGYPYNIELIESWFVIGNYLREAAKLMKFRYDVLRKDRCHFRIGNAGDSLDIITKLVRDTDNLFFHICKLRNKGVIVNEVIADELTYLVARCKNDFKGISKCFCEMIYLFYYSGL